MPITGIQGSGGGAEFCKNLGSMVALIQGNLEKIMNLRQILSEQNAQFWPCYKKINMTLSLVSNIFTIFFRGLEVYW